MNLISQIFAAVIIASLTGTVLFGVWILFQKLYKKASPEILYGMLQIVVLAYIIPIGYLFMLVFYQGSLVVIESELYYGNFFGNPFMNRIMKVAAVVWGMAILAVLAVRSCQICNWSFLLEQNIEEDDEKILREVERISKKVGMKGQIQVCRNSSCPMPVITGLRNKKIVLPMQQYTMEELDIIFFHELSHAKNHDLNIKFISVLVTVIHCFNPAVYFLGRYLKEWSEFYCDWCVRRYCSDEFTIKEYYTKILEFAEARKENSLSMLNMAGLFENKSTLKKRISFMKKYQKQKAVTKIAVAACFCLFLILTTLTAYACGRTVTNFHDTIYRSSDTVIMKEQTYNETKKFIRAEDEWSERKEENAFDASEDCGVLKLQLGGKTRMLSSPVYYQAGQKLLLDAMSEQIEQTQIGILDLSGTFLYIDVTDCNWAEYEIEKDGNYYLFIQNQLNEEKEISFLWSIE